jgi:lysophospholipase L1-like esterase
MNFSLSGDQQVHSFAGVIAQQARIPLTMPLIAEPGVPAKLMLNPAAPPVVIQMPGISTGRIDPTLQATNLSVPGHTVADALTRRPSLPIIDPVDQIQTLTNLVLGFPGLLQNMPLSQVEQVERFAQVPATKPTLIVVWLGSNDALLSVLVGNPSAVTPPLLFASLYSQLIDRLKATGATVVVANIPDVTTLPYLTEAGKLLTPMAQAAGVPVEQLYTAIGVKAGDYLLPSGVERVQLMARNRQFERLGALCPSVLPGLPGPVGCALRAGEIKAIRLAITLFNAIIAIKARLCGAVVVDIHSLLDDISRRGYVVEGRRLTTEFLGGLFSLDGVHPTATGHAIIANEFIKTMNRELSAGIPPVSVRQVAESDLMLRRLTVAGPEE